MKTWCQAFAFKINLYRYTSGFAQERHATENKRPVMFCKVHSGDRWKEGRRVAAGHKPESAAASAPGAHRLQSVLHPHEQRRRPAA